MTVAGRAVVLPPFVRGFDVYGRCTEAMLREATAKGYGAAGRYLQTLDPGERDLHWQYGFPILLYLVAMTKTPLSVQTGVQYGQVARGKAVSLGVAPGVHLCIDLEDAAPGSDEGGHTNALATQLAGGGWPSALYLGAPPPKLTSSQVFALKPERYIKGGGRLLEPDELNVLEPPCGWAAIQLEPLEHDTLDGVKVDTWISKYDYMGRSLHLWGPPAT
jgi:hypothetical protein